MPIFVKLLLSSLQFCSVVWRSARFGDYILHLPNFKKNRFASPRKNNSIAIMHQVYICSPWETMFYYIICGQFFKNRPVKYVTLSISINCNKALCNYFFCLYVHKLYNQSFSSICLKYNIIFFIVLRRFFYQTYYDVTFS